MTWLRSAIYLLLLVLTILLFGIVMFSVVRWLPQKFIDRFVQSWTCFNIWLQRLVCGLGYEVQGMKHLDALPAIVMAKHQSAWETFALPCLLPSTQSWVLKKELLRIPFFGWALRLFGSIPIDRKAGRRAIQQVVQEGLAALQQGRSVIIFPEGTRTAPGKKGKYHIGGAVLATESQYPVIPVAHNSGVFWESGKLKRHPGTIQVRIGPPISTTDKTSAELMAAVESWIETEMLQLPSQRE